MAHLLRWNAQALAAAYPVYASLGTLLDRINRMNRIKAKDP